MKMKDEYDFSNATKNPFIDKIKNGYSVIVHYGPPDKKLFSYDEILDLEMERIRIAVSDKIKDLPRDQLEKKFDEIFDAVVKC